MQGNSRHPAAGRAGAGKRPVRRAGGAGRCREPSRAQATICSAGLETQRVSAGLLVPPWGPVRERVAEAVSALPGQHRGRAGRAVPSPPARRSSGFHSENADAPPPPASSSSWCVLGWAFRPRAEFTESGRAESLLAGSSLKQSSSDSTGSGPAVFQGRSLDQPQQHPIEEESETQSVL